MKQNKWKLIVPVLVAALLAAAFWYGGGSPGSQGWTAPPASSQIPDTREPDSSGVPDVEPPAESSSGEETPDRSGEHTPDMPEPEPEKSESDQSEENGRPDRDQYLTDPVPEGRPDPVEPHEAQTGTEELSCTISISCATILDNMDWLAPDKTDLAPESGWLLEPTEVTFYEGESVFNVLRRTCKQQKLHMEFRDTPMYNSAYIEGIGNLYEFDCGEQSGWMYAVNDWYPNYGCSRYQLQNGDVVCWRYTCDLGADIGGSNAVGG